MKEVALKPELENVTPDSSCFSRDELDWQKLWNVYFKSIEIRERSNPRLQRQHLPVRYWKYLTEEIGRDRPEFGFDTTLQSNQEIGPG